MTRKYFKHFFGAMLFLFLTAVEVICGVAPIFLAFEVNGWFLLTFLFFWPFGYTTFHIFKDIFIYN